MNTDYYTCIQLGSRNSPEYELFGETDFIEASPRATKKKKRYTVTIGRTIMWNAKSTQEWKKGTVKRHARGH